MAGTTPMSVKNFFIFNPIFDVSEALVSRARQSYSCRQQPVAPSDPALVAPPLPPPARSRPPTLDTRPDTGLRAQEHEKLLFYWPADVGLDKKMNYIGLTEALVKYTATFSPGQPIEVLRTQKTRQVYLNPEPNFWISMVSPGGPLQSLSAPPPSLSGPPSRNACSPPMRFSRGRVMILS